MGIELIHMIYSKYALLTFSLLLSGCFAADAQKKVMSPVQSTSSSNGSASAAVTLTDMGALTRVSPESSPSYSTPSLTLYGNCNTGSVITLSGDDSQFTICGESQYAFIVNKTVDGNYSFTITQSGSAKLPAQTLTHTWVRSDPPDAVTITSPTADPSYSSASLNLSGGCTTGNTVYISGDNTESALCIASTYSLVANQSVDGSYSYSLLQRKPNGTPSASISHQWIRDSQSPSVNITATPPSINIVSSAVLAFTSAESFGFLCKLDGASYSSCTSAITYAGLSNGAHTFNVKSGNDLAGNPDLNPQTYTWSQQNFNTVALYHFNNAPGATIDSSSYTGSANNLLITDSNTSVGGSAKFGQSRSFTAISLSHMDAPDNITQPLLAQTMSVEGWVRFNTLPSNSAPMIIASKMGTSGQYSWAVGVIRIGGGGSSDYRITFDASLDGFTLQTRQLSTTFTPGTGSFRHIAVTWNKGVLKFFYNGTYLNTTSLGSGLALFDSSAPLSLGAGSSGAYLNGMLDEVRLSKVLRWTGAGDYSAPGSPYTPD